jgi:hypothetical protein
MVVLKAIKEYFILMVNNIVLLTGTGIFAHSLFSFNYYYNTGKASKYLPTIPNHYYYDSIDKNLLTIGAILIGIGLLMRVKRNEKKL